MQHSAYFILILTLSLFAGCCCDSVGVPNLLHPGDIATQRAKMERFDPLPQTGFSHDVAGGRGQGFENPMAPERRAAIYSQSLVDGEVAP